jgi:hypothetical protein
MKTFAHRAASTLLASAVVALSATSFVAAELPSYRIDSLGPNLQGFGMNEKGHVVGRSIAPSSYGKAFVWTLTDGVTILPLPAEWQSSDAYAINDNGVIVGAVSSGSIASIGSHAAAWFPTRNGWEFQFLGALPGHMHSTALGVNNQGDIVGGSGGIGLGMYSHSVLFTGATVENLPEIGLAVDVNNERVVLAGNMLLDLDTMETTTIPLPPGNWQGVVAGDINNVGGFCGYILGYSGCSTFPIIWMPGTGWDFVGGCATTTSATSINDQGDTLTYVYSGGINAVFFDEGIVNIPALVAPGQGTWFITGMSIINNNRQILGSGKPGFSAPGELIVLSPIVVGDLDGDLVVGAADLAILLGQWGQVGGSADLDQNGVVDASDLSVLLGAWNA